MENRGYRFPDCLCGQDDRSIAFEYRERPEGETDFGIPPDSYAREVLRCNNCGHFVSTMSADMERMLQMSYDSSYVDATYTNEAGMLATFERIMNLPHDQSDNRARADRVDQFLRRTFQGEGSDGIAILDVGAGLGVFPAAMHGLGYDVTALDPDPRAAAHAENNIGVKALCCEFDQCPEDHRYDLITFNKVLEHIKDPCRPLVQALSLLTKRGVIYLELPDGPAAEPHGPGREEFFIEHHHVFSPRSAELLADMTGYRTVELERVHEPSDKYTLRLFIEPSNR